jgi:hypothetical protein
MRACSASGVSLSAFIVANALRGSWKPYQPVLPTVPTPAASKMRWPSWMALSRCGAMSVPPRRR